MGVTETRHVTRTASVGIVDTDYQINIVIRTAMRLLHPVASPFDRQSSAQVEFKINQPYKLPPEDEFLYRFCFYIYDGKNDDFGLCW